jgi:hypothetical protein
MEVDDEGSSFTLVESGAGDDEDNEIDKFCAYEREIELNRITATNTSSSKMEISENAFYTQHSDNDVNYSGPITLIDGKRPEQTVHPSSSSLLVKLNARMKLQAEMGNSSLVAGRKKATLVSGNLKSDEQGPLSLQAVTNGVPTIQSLHTALLKHGKYQHLIVKITALYVTFSNSPHIADNAMALIGGTSLSLRNQRAVHMSAADDLLLQIPSGPISIVGRAKEAVSKSALNFLQKSILMQECLIMKKVASEKEKTDSKSQEKQSLFRTFAKSSSALMAPMVRRSANNHSDTFFS